MAPVSLTSTGARTGFLTTLGTFRIEIEGRAVTPSSEAARHLLAILALSAERRESRSRLAGLLWEDSGETEARARLRQALYRLRTDLGQTWDGIEADRSAISIRPDMLVTDLDCIHEDLSRAVVPAALVTRPDITSHLLVALPERGQLYASWLAILRRNEENRLRQALMDIMRTGTPDQCNQAARALISLDPSDETAVRHLIESHAISGDIGRALQVYSDLWNHLEQTFGMEPSAATQDLVVAIKSGDRVTVATAVLPDPAPLRILVEGTEAYKGDADQTVALFRASLIGALARFREFDVHDGTLSADIQADYRLRFVQSSLGQTRYLAVALVDGSDGRALWSERYGVEAGAWHESLLNATGNVASACSLNISRARLAGLRRSGGAARAVDHWLLGQLLLDEFRVESWDEAVGHFDAAIAIDPDFSGAYSSLAQVQNIRHLVFPGVLPDPVALSKSRDLANKAIALDPADSRAHLCRAWASMLMAEYDYAANAFRDALACNPNDPWTVISCGLGAAFGGNDDLAHSLSQRALSEKWANAPSIWGYLANIRYLFGEFEGAVAAADNAGTTIINIPAWKAASLFRMGAVKAAADAWSEFERAARRAWAAEVTPTTESLLHWFSHSFPIRRRNALSQLRSDAKGAAEAYLHCTQR